MGRRRADPNNTLPPGVERTSAGKYRGRYLVEGRKRSTLSYTSIRAAETALAEAKADLSRGEWLDPADGAINLTEWFDTWHPDRALAPSTMYSDRLLWRRHIDPRIGAVKLTALSPWKVSQWMAQMEAAGVPDASRRKALVLLRTSMEGAIADRRLRYNPTAGVRKPRIEKPSSWVLLSGEDVDRILSKIGSEQHRRMVEVAAYTGMRWSEVAGMQRSDFNPIRRTVTVQRATVCVGGKHTERPTTKSGKPRTVPLHPRALSALNEQLAGRDAAPDTRVFATDGGGPLDPSHFRRDVWLPAIKAAGVTARFHDLRHSCASRLLAGGMDLAQVKEIMGHSSVTVTELYLHTDEDAKRDALLRAFGG
jgi:integrase